MSFAVGFAKGLADSYVKKTEEVEDRNAQKRQYYRKLMYEQALPAYYQKKQMASKYKDTLNTLQSYSPNVPRGQLAKIVNDAGGDLEQAVNLLGQARFESNKQNNKEQGSSGRPVNTFNSVQEAEQAAQARSNSIPSASGQPMSSQNYAQTRQAGSSPEQTSDGRSFVDQMLGRKSDKNLRNEVAKGIAADLGLDDESFSGIMQEAFSEYELEGAEGGVTYQQKDPLSEMMVEKVITGVSNGTLQPPEGMEASTFLKRVREANNSGDSAALDELVGSIRRAPGEPGMFEQYISKLRDTGRDEQANAMESAWAQRQAYGSPSIQQDIVFPIIKKMVEGEEVTPQERKALFASGNMDIVGMMMLDPEGTRKIFNEMGGSDSSEQERAYGNTNNEPAPEEPSEPQSKPSESQQSEKPPVEVSIDEVNEWVERQESLDRSDAEAVNEFIAEVEERFGSYTKFLETYEYYGGEIGEE